MSNWTNRDPLIADLCFALDVMEEHTHLGLDDETAINLRKILVRQIDDARTELLSDCPPGSVHIPFVTKVYAWRHRTGPSLITTHPSDLFSCKACGNRLSADRNTHPITDGMASRRSAFASSKQSSDGLYTINKPFPERVSRATDCLLSCSNTQGGPLQLVEQHPHREEDAALAMELKSAIERYILELGLEVPAVANTLW